MNTTFSADHWVDVHAPSPASSSRRSSFTAISPPSKTAMSVAIRQARALMATRDGRNDQAALEIVNKALRTAESGQLVPREEEELMSDADLVEREIVIGSWQAEDDRTPAATAAIEEDDADWDIPLVPRIIGLRNSGVVPPPSPTMSSAATYAPTEHEASVTPEVAAAAAAVPATATVDAQHAEQQAPGSADDAHQKDQLAAPPKIVPSEQEMAEHRRVADPLGELAASWLWKHCQYGGSYPSVLLHDIRSVLTQTMLNPTVILLALHYVSRLPIPHIHHPNDPRGLFRKALSEHSQQLVPYKLFCLGAMLANKWLDDNTFSNKTWHEVTQIPLIAINGLENAALAFFKFDISVPEHDWSRFLYTLKAQHAMSSPPLAPIGSARCPHALVSNIFDTLLAAGRPPTPASPRSPPQPYFIGKAALVEKKMREMQEREEIEKLDLDEGGPMRSEYLPQAVHGQHLASHAPLKEWSPADDPKVETRPARPSYIAIQRPGALSTISNFPQGHMAPAVDVYQRPYDVFNPAPGPVQRPHTYYPTQNIYGLADYSANAYYPAPTGPTYAPQYPPAYYQVPNPVITQASGWPTAPSWNHQAPWVRT